VPGRAAAPAVEGERRDDVDVEDVALPLGPGRRTLVRIFRPGQAERALPVVLHLQLGAPLRRRDDVPGEWLARELAAGTGAAVLMPELAPAGRHRQREVLEQSYELLCWIAREGARRQLDGSRIALAGGGLGGSLAAALALLAARRAGPALRTQALLCPAADPASDIDTYRRPLRTGADRLTGLPPALIITAEADELREQAEAYAAALRAAGVPVVATRFLGTIHQFMTLEATRHTPSARAAIRQTRCFLADTLDGLG